MRHSIGILISGLLFLSAACSGDSSKPAKTPNPPPGAVTPISNSNEMMRGGNSSLGQKPVEEKKDASTSAPETKSQSEISAARIFSEQKCAMCHGEDGKGKLKGAPDFTDQSWQRRQKDPELIEAIKMGKSPKMPAFGAKLKDDEIRAVVAYVRSFAKK